MSRTARIERQTSESKVLVEVDLDGSGRHDISTGVGFYDHMLTAFARHALVDLTVQVEGDVHIDAHHTVEDAAIAASSTVWWASMCTSPSTWTVRSTSAWRANAVSMWS